MKLLSIFQENVKRFIVLIVPASIALCAGCSNDDDIVIVTKKAVSLELFSSGDQTDFTRKIFKCI